MSITYVTIDILFCPLWNTPQACFENNLEDFCMSEKESELKSTLREYGSLFSAIRSGPSNISCTNGWARIPRKQIYLIFQNGNRFNYATTKIMDIQLYIHNLLVLLVLSILHFSIIHSSYNRMGQLFSIICDGPWNSVNSKYWLHFAFRFVYMHSIIYNIL